MLSKNTAPPPVSLTATIAELKAAYTLVINAPMNSSFAPGAMKAWIDPVRRNGHTLEYKLDGSKLLWAKNIPG
ncbi:MAG: NAD(P)H-dependent oxidoreductase [Pseudomonadota bacterium]